MANLTLSSVLVERLTTIQSLQEAFRKRESTMPKRFRRGDLQRQLCQELGIPFIGLNKRIVNEVMASLGYIKITVDGTRYYRKDNG